jgi:hypothetical protein
MVLVAAGLLPGGPQWRTVIEVEQGTMLPIWLARTAHHPLDQRITFTLHLVDDAGEQIAQVDQEMGGAGSPRHSGTYGWKLRLWPMSFDCP